MANKHLVIQTKNTRGTIRKEVYGHFSEHLGRCIYNGIFVPEDSDIPNHKGMRDDVVQALKDMKIPVLRWPGGCFADEYHWQNGIGPKENRVKMINTHWGGITEDNSFGTHEFMELCRQLECEPYISGNVGSGTVRELSEWIEYMTSDAISPMTELRKENGQEEPWHLKYLGIGNENWGCGGNMTPEYYANVYRHFQTYCRNYGNNRLFKIACGPNGADYEWTEKLMQIVKPWHADAISLHFYTVVDGNWVHKGSATDFDDVTYYKTIYETQKIEPMIDKHLAIMDRYDPEHRMSLAIDEWGCWFDVEEGTNPGFLYQQNTMRDAIVAAMNLNIFNRRAERICMANIAQVVNVLQAVILTEGSKMIKTPTYHVFCMYKDHQDATAVESVLSDTVVEHDGKPVQEVSVSSSVKDDKLTITLCNASLSESYTLDTVLDEAYASWTGTILTGKATDYNTFDNPEQVVTADFDGCTLTGTTANIVLPPCSVVTLTLTK